MRRSPTSDEESPAAPLLSERSAQFLSISLWLSTGLGLVTAGYGISLTAQDVVAETYLDGLGLVMGLAALVCGMAWALSHWALALWLTHAVERLRDHDHRTPLAAVSTASSLLAVGLLWLLWGMEPFGPNDVDLTLLVGTAVLGATLLAGVSAATLAILE